jgi:hypothetical protein
VRGHQATAPAADRAVQRRAGTGLVHVRPVTPAQDPTAPPGTLEWTSWTGWTYRHQPPEAAVPPARGDDIAHAAAVVAERAQNEVLLDRGEVLDENYDLDWALRDWDRSLRKLREQRPEPDGTPKETRPTLSPRPARHDPPPF